MATWTIDTVHSEIGFKVKHLVISTVSGKFNSFEGKLEGEVEDLTNAKISFSADVDSISTGNEQRDGHLKSGDFFEVATHPKLTFVSTSIALKEGNEYKLTGDFTMKGVTKSITLDVEFGGIQKSLYGQTVAGFEVSGKINRLDYGVAFNAVTETGGIVLADEIKLIINVELIKE